jgi:hypothetical protein
MGTDVWQVNLGVAAIFTFSVTSAVFTPDIALLQTTCADNANCITETTSGTGTATSDVISGNPPGTYFIIVTDSTGLGAQCGAYNLTLTGPLPDAVKLQDFSVQ